MLQHRVENGVGFTAFGLFVVNKETFLAVNIYCMTNMWSTEPLYLYSGEKKKVNGLEGHQDFLGLPNIDPTHKYGKANS